MLRRYRFATLHVLDRLDAYGTDDPGYNEGHPEDHCPVPFCYKPVSDHPCWWHRFAALLCIVAGRVLGLIKDTGV